MTVSVSAARRWGVYHSLEETLSVLKADDNFSIPEVKNFVSFFSELCSKFRNSAQTNVVKRHLFVVVEGLDGSGKSTLTKQLSKCLKGVVMSTPGPQFEERRAFFDKQPNHLRRAYYSLCNYAVAMEIQLKLENCPVILDRFWHSTAAYALASCFNKLSDLPDIEDPVYKWPEDLLPYPDKIIVLNVSEKIRMQRLKSRCVTTAEEERLAHELDFRATLCEAYKRMGHNNPQVVEVDANRWPKAVLKDVLGILNQDK